MKKKYLILTESDIDLDLAVKIEADINAMSGNFNFIRSTSKIFYSRTELNSEDATMLKLRYGKNLCVFDISNHLWAGVI